MNRNEIKNPNAAPSYPGKQDESVVQKNKDRHQGFDPDQNIDKDRNSRPFDSEEE